MTGSTVSSTRDAATSRAGLGEGPGPSAASPRLATSERVAPSLLVLGWPKCGTSSLFDWLSRHPEVQPAVPKETFFLMDEDHPLRAAHGSSFRADGEDGWNTYFDGPAHGRLRLEATTHHVFQETARRYVASLDPVPHAVFVLREPASRVLSSFRYTRDNLAAIDPVFSFDRYVEALLAGRGDEIARHYRSPASLWVAQRELVWSDYARWLDLWASVLPKDHMHLVLFEDLVHRPLAARARLLARIGLAEHAAADDALARKNATYRVRLHRLHRLIRTLNARLPSGPWKARLRDRYLALQRGSAAPETRFETGLELLSAHFASQRDQLERRFNLQIGSLWHV